MRSFAQNVGKFLSAAEGVENSTDCRWWDSSEAPRRALMAPSADSEVVSSERSFTIVTSHTTLAASGRMMIQRLRCGYLPALWHSGSHLMAFIAGHLLVFRMTEADTVRLRENRCSRIAAELMTRTTRGNVASG